MAGKVTRSAADRFWEKVNKTSGGCWLWAANISGSNGYGRFWLNGKSMRAHRFAWVSTFGPFDEVRLRVLHKCDTPTCVNPEHLFLGTLKENSADRDRKGRGASGERNGNRKLTEDLVREIRASDESSGVLARRLHIDKSQVCNIRRHKQWKHV